MTVEKMNASLTEEWGVPVDTTEFMNDEPGFGGTARMGSYTKIYDRADGRYMPVYQNESDLKLIRAICWLMSERVPMAQAWCNRLLDYTVGTGFDWTISHEKKDLQGYLKRYIEDVLDCSDWSSDLERESYVREIVDGEWIAELEWDGRQARILTREADELTAPVRTRDLEEWLGIDDFVPSWSFGVLTSMKNTEVPIGYHFVRDDAGRDWDYVKACHVVHWKRNVRAKAKRGVGDFYRPHLYLLRADKVLTNTAEGASTQAAIAYIVEHPPSGTKANAEAIAARFAPLTGRVDPQTGEMQRRRRMAPNTRIDVPNGAKYHASLLGSNASNVYIEVMEAALRLAGTVHGFPEGMLTGSYANNNLASSLTAESPFVQGRVSEQLHRAGRIKKLLMKLLKIAAEAGMFSKMGCADWSDLRAGLDIDITPAKVFPRDVLQLTQALKLQKEAGWVSDKSAMTELGRDAAVEKANLAEQKPAEVPGQNPGMPGVPGQNQPPGGQSVPRGTVGPDGKPVAPAGGEWMGLTRMQWTRNRKAITDVVNDLAAGKSKRSTAKVLLAGLGIPLESINLLLQDASDGKIDTPMPEGLEWFGDLRESLNVPSVKKKRVRSRVLESVTGFDETKHPRGPNGKFIDSGMGPVTSKWSKLNSAANSAKKKIQMMEVLAAKGEWEKLHASYVAPAGKKLNSYQAGMLKAKENLLKLQTQAVMTPPKGSIEVPGTAAVAGFMPVPTPPKSEHMEFQGSSKIGGKLGTENGGTYIGPDGGKYYVKTPDNHDRAKNEVLATKLYALAGGSVVNADLVMVDGKLGVASKWMDNSQKVDWNSAEMRNQAAKDFAVHALLANWDAVGAGTENPMDNIRLHNGKLVLVDAGGALEYSGMGGSGKKEFTATADEWENMRNPKVNPSAAKVFGSMTHEQLIEAGEKLNSMDLVAVGKAIDKYHPGTETQRNELKIKLIQRKESILGKVKQLKADIQWKKDQAAAIADASDKAAIDAHANPEPVAAKPVVQTPTTPTTPHAAKAPIAVPPPPFTTSVANQSVNKKFQAIWDAAATGDISKVEAIATNSKAKQTYAVKQHAYKLAVIAAMQSGGVPHGTPVVPPIVAKGAAPKPVDVPSPAVSTPAPKPATGLTPLQKSMLPSMPDFMGKHKGVNELAIQKLNAMALAGDPAIEAFSSLSPKVNKHKDSLVAMLKNPPPPPAPPIQFSKSIDSGKIKLAAAVKMDKHAKEKAGQWVVHGKVPGDFTPMTPAQNWVVGETQWKEGHKAMTFLYPEEKTALAKYTGGSYGAINDALREGHGTEATKQLAKNTVKALSKASVPLTVGQTLSRKYSVPDIDAHVANLKPGSVVADKGVLSTSSAEGVWNGNVHFKLTVGEGVRGLPIGNKSSCPGESEYIISPNQRILITAVEHTTTKLNKKPRAIIHAIILPTVQEQYHYADE